MDKKLWKIENYLDFLQPRQALLAEETNRRMTELLHGEDFWLEGEIREPEVKVVFGGISSEEEEQEGIS